MQKAYIGDYLRIGDQMLRVIDVTHYSETERTYFLSNGGCVGESDFDIGAVYLESEAIGDL